MEINQWLNAATAKLTTVGVGSARLDALILLEDELGKDRSYLLAHPETPLQSVTLQRLNKRIARRATHEPLAYIRGFSEFYGRRFKVNKRVLEPRPESETMAELLKALLTPKPSVSKDRPWKQAGATLTIADVGTGSGAIGITAKLEIPESEVDLYDIDSACLAVARHNAVMHELHLHCYKRDLLNRPAQNYDIILANLPYVPNGWKINQAAGMEPRLAIFGGKDGLDLYRRLFAQIEKLEAQPKFVLTEALPPQHEVLAKIAQGSGYKLLKSQDFIQVFKNT